MVSSLTYAERLRVLNLESLELRRLKFDLILIFKIINGYVDINCGRLFEFFSKNLNLRGHQKKIIKPQSRINCRSHSFACRNVNAWNYLPGYVIDSTSCAVFKNRLNTVDFSKFLSDLNWYFRAHVIG